MRYAVGWGGWGQIERARRSRDAVTRLGEEKEEQNTVDTHFLIVSNLNINVHMQRVQRSVVLWAVRTPDESGPYVPLSALKSTVLRYVGHAVHMISPSLHFLLRHPFLSFLLVFFSPSG